MAGVALAAAGAVQVIATAAKTGVDQCLVALGVRCPARVNKRVKRLLIRQVAAGLRNGCIERYLAFRTTVCTHIRFAYRLNAVFIMMFITFFVTPVQGR